MSDREKGIDDQLAEGCLGFIIGLIGVGLAAITTGGIAAVELWRQNNLLTEENILLRTKSAYSLGGVIEGIGCSNCQTLNEKSITGVTCYNCGTVLAAPVIVRLERTASETLALIPSGVWAVLVATIVILGFCMTCNYVLDL